jgi:hypothetical protein
MVFKLACIGDIIIPTGQVCCDEIQKRIGKSRRLDKDLSDERAVSSN